MMVEIDAKWRVCLEARYDLPVPAPLAWRGLSDFECFACQDLFHSQVLLDGQVPATGVGFSLRHSLLGIGFERVGRILSWHEGQGYGFSDLSQRDTKKGFPHTYFHRIKPVDQKACLTNPTDFCAFALIDSFSQGKTRRGKAATKEKKDFTAETQRKSFPSREGS